MNISQADFSVLINGFLETLSKTERFIITQIIYHNYKFTYIIVPEESLFVKNTNH